MNKAREMDTIPEIIGVSHIDLCLHISHVGSLHVPFEGFIHALLHTLTVIVALADVEELDLQKNPISLAFSWFIRK